MMPLALVKEYLTIVNMVSLYIKKEHMQLLKVPVQSPPSIKESRALDMRLLTQVNMEMYFNILILKSQLKMR